MSFTLLITEKPNASKKIAEALADGKVEKITDNTASYYRITRKGKEIFVVPAAGHLFVLGEKNSNAQWTYPVFDLAWKPMYTNRTSYWSKKYYDNIKSLVKGASEFISACDYDIEGSVIAYNILRFICNVEKGKRMKFSTLTKQDLVEAYDNASKELDYPQIEAGLTRHYLDYFWGINMSRALTLALRAGGAYKTLSSGRVQGPTLEMLEAREREIAKFKPKPFWQIQLDGLVHNNPITAMHENDKFWKKQEAKKALGNAEGKPAVIEKVETKQYKQNPPAPFDLTTLQRDAYANFGLSPKHTLDIAQNLYEAALISYPRTSSQKLPAKLGHKKIMEQLAGNRKYTALCERLLKTNLKPKEGAKSDPAHPAIYPTGAKPKKITDLQSKIYDLIVKRYLACFAKPATRQSVKATIDAGGETFISTGITTLKPGWIDFYNPYVKLKEQTLPEIKEGDPVEVQNLQLLGKETHPPSRFTQATVLKEMEKLNLGTKATRALILQTLYDRGYIRERSIEVTKLGKVVITALEKSCPDIISPKLTERFEKEIEEIQEGKSKREEVVSEARKLLEKILKNFKKTEKEIGKELMEGFLIAHKEANTIGKCPECGKDLIIRQSRAGKGFVGCTGYPDCTNTYSLPQKGYITVISEKCKECGLNVVSVRQKGRRPWKLCIKDGFVNKRKAKTEDEKTEPKGKEKPKPKAKKKATKKKKAEKKKTSKA